MFFYYFCSMIKGSGSLTNGSGRPKNIWILRIRIRIRNTVRNEEGDARSVADFLLSLIPDPRGEKLVVSPFFVAINFTKVKITKFR
jgi:hypothetical protein